MKCANCEKHFATKDCVRVLKGKKSIPVTFCSYTCYLAFWAGCTNFDPLIWDYKPKTKEERQ